MFVTCGLSFESCETDRSFRAAMPLKVSPDFTVYVLVSCLDGGGYMPNR